MYLWNRFLVVCLQLFLVCWKSFFRYCWVSGVPWGSFWQAFWVPGGPRDSILAPKVSFGGSEGPSWTAGGSRGGSMAKTSLFSIPFLDDCGVIFGIKSHSEITAEI